MSEFTPLREAVDDLASRTRSPDFEALKRRAGRRGRRRVVVVAAATASVLAASALAITHVERDRRSLPAEQPELSPAPNGWIAFGAAKGGGAIYLVRPGHAARLLEVAGSDAADDACPTWSPDGRRLLLGRLTGPSDNTARDAQLVIVPVSREGTAGTPKVIGLDGFEAPGDGPEGRGAHPCGTWSRDGRWVAIAATDAVWVVDTQTDALRKLPSFRPSDLDWRPGTDELTIAGDIGTRDGAPTLSTPVTLYSVSNDELHQLGSVEAAYITWSPDGRTLAYTAGERAPETRQLRLVDGDGSNDRTLVADMGPRIHGIGPVWSPTGERIAYQRCQAAPQCTGERHLAVLVNAADGTETVMPPPTGGGHQWYPFTVTWSPDGMTLLYAGWNFDSDTLPEGLVAVPADRPSDATVLEETIDPISNYREHSWTATQMWGRQPE